MNIIDFRFRPHTHALLESTAAAFRDAILATQTIEEYMQKAQSIEEIVADLGKHNVRAAVITGRDIETTFGSKPNNDDVYSFIHDYPDVFKGFMGVDPHKGIVACQEIERRVKEEGFCGISTDPLHARIPCDDDKYYAIYEKCNELKIPVIITAGPAQYVQGSSLNDAHPDRIDRIARDFPKLRIIVSHGAWPYVNELIGVMFRHYNVYAELSEFELFPQSNAFIEAANTILPDKILFASAHPGLDYRVAIARYQELPFKDEVRENVMWKTASKILNLEV